MTNQPDIFRASDLPKPEKRFGMPVFQPDAITLEKFKTTDIYKELHITAEEEETLRSVGLEGGATKEDWVTIINAMRD